mgnify:CR=1 FL=1
MTDKKEMTEAEQQEWVRARYQDATKYLADKGLVTNSVSAEVSRYLVPFIAVWKLNLLDKKSVWVITGDLPSDHIDASVAEDARSAVKHFSLKWQLQAENLLKTNEAEKVKFGQLLVSRADGLYQMSEDDQIWEMQ